MTVNFFSYWLLAATVTGLIFGLVLLVNQILRQNIRDEVHELLETALERRANMETARTKRFDLTKSLVALATEYAAHERSVHGTALERRESGGMGQDLSFVVKIGQAYPDLKVNQTYLKLMEELRIIEGELQLKVEEYNRHARDYNIARGKTTMLLFMPSWSPAALDCFPALKYAGELVGQ